MVTQLITSAGSIAMRKRSSFIIMCKKNAFTAVQKQERNSFIFIFKNEFSPLFIIFTFLVTCITSASSMALFTQQIDPFYTNLLQKGEQSFLAGNYKDAVKELEVANFGLHGRNDFIAKACIYLGLSHYYLKDNVKSEKYLKDAKNLLGDKGFQSVDIDDSVRAALEKLLETFKLAEPPPPLKAEQKRPPEKEKPEEKAGEVETPPLKEKTKKPIVNPVKELERKIKAKPKDVSLYYDLYALHIENNKQKDALKTLRNLIKKNPDEVRGYYLSGKLQYHLRKYRDAEKSFAKVFELYRKFTVAEEILIESRAYLILSTNFRGDKGRTSKIIAASLELFTKEMIDSLNLAERDKVLLHTIIEDYKNKQN